MKLPKAGPSWRQIISGDCYSVEKRSVPASEAVEIGSSDSFERFLEEQIIVCSKYLDRVRPHGSADPSDEFVIRVPLGRQSRVDGAPDLLAHGGAQCRVAVTVKTFEARRPESHF